MSQAENGEAKPAPDPALDGMNKADREETEGILAEIEKDAPKTEDETVVPPKPEEKTPVEEKKPEGEADDQGKKPEARREVKLMPVYAHEAYKDKTSKEIAKLTADLATATGTAPAGTDGGEAAKPGAIAPEALQKEAERIAEAHGITVDLAKDLLDSAVRNAGIPAELQSKLSEVDNLKARHEIEVETAQFNADFDSLILPKIKAEYGDDVPAEVISKVKEDLKALAYDPDGTYAKVPYVTIYQGVDSFRDIIPPVKHGPEETRGGATGAAAAGGGSTAVDLTKPLSDEAISALTPAELDTYLANTSTFEKK